VASLSKASPVTGDSVAWYIPDDDIDDGEDPEEEGVEEGS